MENRLLGGCIAALRQGQGATQEELAQAVGVSSQAVSKWECGGMPDAALLPAIADFLGVPIDRLYGREGVGGNIGEAIKMRIGKMDQETRMREGIQLCFELQKALGGDTGNNSLNMTLEKLWERLPSGHQHSQLLYDSGISMMSVTADIPYFMLLPEPPQGWEKGLFKAEAYAELFHVLGMERAMEALFFLLRRSPQRQQPFTPRLLEKKLGITREQAVDILEGLKRFKLISVAEAELDDAVQTIYNFEPNPALIAVLAAAKELVKEPNSFYFNSNSRPRAYFRDEG